MLYDLNNVMNVNDNRVPIQSKGKMIYNLNMLDSVTETPVMHAAATFIGNYDSSYDSATSHDSLSHTCETKTDTDTTDWSASDSEGEPVLSQHIFDNDLPGRLAEQGYQMLDTTTTLHACLDCDSAKEMISQVQLNWSYYADIHNSEIQENDSDYDNIDPSSEVGPDSIMTNTLSTLVMYEAIVEFPALFPELKPTELRLLREPLQIFANRMDVISNSVWIPRFPCTYNQFKDQITKKIITELETSRIVPSKSRNLISMFTQPKRHKL